MHQQKVLGMVAGDPVSKDVVFFVLQANWRYLNIAVNIQTVVLAG